MVRNGNDCKFVANMKVQSNIVIVGAGPAGLMAAQQLAKKGYAVSVYEQKPAAARKFLVAGHGGFNITHNMPYGQMLAAYSHQELVRTIRDFTNEDTIIWLQEIGIPTYVGSSGKIFPQKGIKPIEVLQAWLQYLQQLGVTIHYGYTLLDFDAEALTFATAAGIVTVPYSKMMVALGGGSWPKTGSDAKWVPLFEEKHIPVTPLLPANSGFELTLPTADLEAQTLKNVVVHLGEQQKMGELVFTTYGIEGAPIYYMNRFVRHLDFPFEMHIDLKPTYSLEQLQKVLQHNKQAITTCLKTQLNLAKTSIALLKLLPKEVFMSADLLAAAIKAYPLTVTSLRPLEEVISTAGGVSWSALNLDLSLKAYPNIYCIGEMLDWEAPTGGYLLQACLANGHFVAQSF